MKILLLTTVLLIIAILGLSIRLIFTKKGNFSGGSCQNQTKELRNHGISCGCSNTESCA